MKISAISALATRQIIKFDLVKPCLLVMLAALPFGTRGLAATLYWEPTGTTGANYTGTWTTVTTTLDWNTDSTGVSTPLTGWTQASQANFSVTDPNAVGLSTITLAGAALQPTAVNFLSGSGGYTFSNGEVIDFGVNDQGSGLTYNVLTVSPGVGPVTFNGGVSIAPAEAASVTSIVTNNSSSLLTFGGAIINDGNAGAASILTISGTGGGGVTISGAIQNNGNNPTGRATALVINTTGASGTGAVTLLSDPSNGTTTGNIYNGGTTVTSGILRLSNGATTGLATGAFNIGAAGLFDLNGNNDAVGAFNGTAGGVIYNDSATNTNVNLTIGNGNAAGTFAGTLEDNNNGGATTGTLSLTKAGTGTITLTGSNINSGATIVAGGGGGLTLSGNGALANTASITVGAVGQAAPTLTYDNSAAGAANAARLGTAPITLNGGILAYKGIAAGTNTAGTGSSGAITLGAGLNSGFNFTAAAGTGNTSTFTIPSLTFGAHSTLTAFLATANGSIDRIVIASAPALINGILPWMVETSNGNFGTVVAGTDYLGAYGNITGSDIASFDNSPASNVKITSAQSALSAATVENSLVYSVGATQGLGGNTLTLTSGGLILNNVAAVIGSSANDGIITTGTGSQDLYVDANTAATINSSVADNGAPVTLDKYGATTLTLNGSNSNTGGVYVEQGTLALGVTGNVGSSQVNVQGGATLGFIGGTAGAVANVGTIAQTTGSSTDFGTISGAGILTVSGGTLVLSGSNNYTGATTVSAGALQAVATAANLTGTNSAALSSNSVYTLSGGTLQLRADANDTFTVGSASTLTAASTIDVNAISTGSNNIIALNGLTYLGNGPYQVNITGGAGDYLKLGAVSSGNNGNTQTFNVTSGNLVASSYTAGSGNNYILALTGSGNIAFLGAVSAHDTGHNLGLTVNSTGTVTLDGANQLTQINPDPASPVLLMSGTLILNNATPFNPNTSGPLLLGNAAASTTPAALLLGGTNTPNSYGVVTNPVGGVNFSNRQIFAEASDTASLTIGGVNTSGTDTFGFSNAVGSAIVLGSSGTAVAGKSINIVEATGGTLLISGTISNQTTDTTAGINVGDLSGNNNGVVRLTAVNTFQGPTNISSGVLQVNGSLAAGSTANVLTSGTLGGTGAVLGNATLTGNGAVAFGAGGHIGGTLTVNGGNWSGLGSVTGIVTVNSGNFNVGTGANLTASNGVNVAAGTISSTDATGTITGSLNYASSSTSTYGGVIAGAGSSVTASGPGALVLGGSNTYGGGTTITGGGTLQLGNGTSGFDGTLGTTMTVNDGGNLVFNRFGNITDTAAITGTGNVTVSGPGAETLTAANSSYSGVTTVTGKLIVSGGISGSTAVNVGAGGVLEADGSINSAAVVTVNGGTLEGASNAGAGGSVGAIAANGGTLAPGNGTSVSDASSAGTLTANGNVTLSGSTTFSIRLGVASSSDHDQLAVSGGTVSLNGATLSLSAGSAYVPGSNSLAMIIINGGYNAATSGTFSNAQSLAYVNGDYYQILYGYDPSANGGTGGVDASGTDVAIQFTAVPEPRTWAMFLGGLAFLILCQRRRSRVNRAA